MLHPNPASTILLYSTLSQSLVYTVKDSIYAHSTICRHAGDLGNVFTPRYGPSLVYKGGELLAGTVTGDFRPFFIWSNNSTYTTYKQNKRRFLEMFRSACRSVVDYEDMESAESLIAWFPQVHTNTNK